MDKIHIAILWTPIDSLFVHSIHVPFYDFLCLLLLHTQTHAHKYLFITRCSSPSVCVCKKKLKSSLFLGKSSVQKLYQTSKSACQNLWVNAILKFMSTTFKHHHWCCLPCFETVYHCVCILIWCKNRKRKNERVQIIKMWQKLGVRMQFHHRQTGCCTLFMYSRCCLWYCCLLSVFFVFHPKNVCEVKNHRSFMSWMFLYTQASNEKWNTQTHTRFDQNLPSKFDASHSPSN